MGQNGHEQGRGNELLGRGGKAHQGAGHNDGLAAEHPAHGFLHAELRGDALEGEHHVGAVVELGVHGAGAEGTDIDRTVLLPQLLSHAAGQADNVCLGGVVARHIGPARQQARRGCHVQDGAEALCFHLAQGELEQPVHGQHVHPQHGKLLARVRLGKGTAGTKARVVDEQVDAFVCQCFAQGGDLRILRKVGGYDAAEGAVFRPELGGKGLQPVAAAGGQNEPEAQPGIAAGKLPLDAGGRAGDPDSFG